MPATKTELKKLIDQTPAEQLPSINVFIDFLETIREKPIKPRAKIVTVPASYLLEIAGTIPGYEGDAFEDSESLYDDL